MTDIANEGRGDGMTPEMAKEILGFRESVYRLDSSRREQTGTEGKDKSEAWEPSMVDEGDFIP